jgi:hypothetical protein
MLRSSSYTLLRKMHYLFNIDPRAATAFPNHFFIESDGSLSMRLYMGQALYDYYFVRARLEPKGGILGHARPWIELSAADVQRMRLSSKWWYQHGYERELVPHYALIHKKSEFVTYKASDWFAVNSMFALVMGLCFAGLAYGGLHLVAWNAPFPSQREQLLWRISAAYLVATGPFVIVAFASVGITNRVNSRDSSAHFVIAILGFPILVAIVAAFVVCCLAYPVARIYLIVECFISMGRLPDSVYRVQSWSQYVPHIG